jgi:hypothetical protein
MFREGRAREGQISSGYLHWSSHGRSLGSIGYFFDLIDPNDARLTLKISLGSMDGGRELAQIVPLRFTSPHYGGRRWWMICPVHHARVAKLYMPLNAHRFAGRRAWHLGYRSQRTAPANQPLERLFRLRTKLGLERGCNDRLVRPQGMWRRTFTDHQAQHNDLSRQILDAAVDCTPQLAAYLASQAASARRLNGPSGAPDPAPIAPRR